MNLSGAAAAVVLASLASPVWAETSAVSPAGFSVNFREEVKASSDQTWKAIVQLPRWWTGMHTYSGQASNLSLDIGAGGCWCERWGDGQAVMHDQVLAEQFKRLKRLAETGQPE